MPAPRTVALPKGLMIAAPRSGGGKTTVALGLMRAMARRGLKVQPFKAGPDYIDPAFHGAAAGRPSFNIDSWAMRWPTAAGLLESQSSGADIVIAEALMGLFDGVSTPGHWGTGASADFAAATGWPVVLVLDVSGQSQTAAAGARGFCGFRQGVDIAGVILNRVGSERHVRLASEGLAQEGIEVLGALPRSATVGLPERHLGLVQAEETSGLQHKLDGLADFVSAHVNIDRLLGTARAGAISCQSGAALPPPGQRIALARDAAFSFVYPHLVEGWCAQGAEILPFSPLANEAPDETADVVWLPGGYPELHAGPLAAAQNFKTSLRHFAETRPVHGECGGYMTLGAGLIDASGVRHEMIGLLGLETSFSIRKMQLGYRKARFVTDCVLGACGHTVTGHEFHYATIMSAPDEPLFDLATSEAEALDARGSRRGRVTGSFFHVIDG